MATVKAVLWKQKERDGEHPIYIRIEASNRRRYISTGEWIKPRHWNPNRNEVRKTHPLADKLNDLIGKHVREAKSAILDLKLSNEAVTPAAVKATIQPIEQPSDDLIRYGEAYAEELLRLNKISTGRRYASIMRKVREWTGGAVPFSRVSSKFIREYELHMVEDLSNGPSTVASNMRALKAILNRAAKDGLFPPDANIFEGVKLTEPPGEKRKLDIGEIETIRALDLEPLCPLARVRDLWMFSMYCGGIRFSDVISLRAENVQGGRLTYQMGKSLKYKNLDLPPVASEIVDRYLAPGAPRETLVFPMLRPYDLSTAAKFRRSVSSQNAYTNKLLKELAAAAGVKRRLSFHMSRHSFANVALTSGWSVRKIQAALGHGDIKTTERYLRELDAEFTGEEMGRLFST